MAFPFLRWFSKLDFHLRCYKFSSKQKEHLTKEAGNRVLLPVNCLRAISDRFSDMISDANSPLLFKVINPVLQRQHQHPPVRPIFTGGSSRNVENNAEANSTTQSSVDSTATIPQFETHCGVYEFTADDGQMYMPDWILTALGLSDNSSVTIELVERTPKGKFVRLQPLDEDFFTRVSNPKVLLEFFLRHFVCLTKNEIITINYLNNDFRIRVTESKPADVICIVDCDVEVDFEEPPNGAANANLLARDKFNRSTKTSLRSENSPQVGVDSSHRTNENESVFVPVASLPESMRKIVLEEGKKFAGSGQKLQDKKPGKKKRKSSSFSATAAFNPSPAVSSSLAIDGSLSNLHVTNKYAVTEDGKIDVIAAGFRGVPNYDWSPLQCKLYFRRRRVPSSAMSNVSTLTSDSTVFAGSGNVLGRAAHPPTPLAAHENISDVPLPTLLTMPPASIVNQDGYLSAAINNNLNASRSSLSRNVASANSLYTWHSALSTQFRNSSNNNRSGSESSDKVSDDVD